MLYNDEIAVTANRSDTEPHRLERLQRVVGYLCSEDETLLSAIAKLHDHKGILKVTWRDTPSTGQRRAVAKAWQSLIGDGSDVVEHSCAEKLRG